MLNLIREDIRKVYESDPAAKNFLEVFFCYPGLHALWLHRIAHRLYRGRWFTLARLISHFNRWLTGIEVHPGAKIGRRVFIDHGMGIVIGETAEVGDDCLLYKGVVLGGTTLEKKKRHPTLGKEVVVGSNACILGAIEIGDGARIGSGSVVVKSVSPGATVVGVPAREVERKSEHERREETFEHGNLPDPLSDIVKILLELQEKLDSRLRLVEAELEGLRARLESPEEKVLPQDKECQAP
ncbi:MAG: serine O-acetyltransferase [Nitrospinota bacterium]